MSPTPRRAASLALAAATILFAALPVPVALAQAAAPDRADRLTIGPRPVEDLKAVFATVESVHETVARTRISGTIADLKAREGDKVTEGQVLAVVRDPKMPLQIAANDARTQALEAQLRQAELDLARARQLRASGTGTQQALDAAQANVDIDRGQLAAMKADRSVTEEQLREGTVYAPANGRILQVKVVEGAVVLPGEAVATIATETHVLRLHLPERHARFMHEGDTILVGARGLAPAGLTNEADAEDTKPDTLKKGMVTLVYPELSNGQVVADATVPGLGDFFVGERVRVYVATGTRQAIVIPPDYLIRRFGTDFLRLADGREVPVQVGGTIPQVGGQPGGLEVLSGLKAGDVVVRPEGA